jgi:hypothetical protein
MERPAVILWSGDMSDSVKEALKAELKRIGLKAFMEKYGLTEDQAKVYKN